MKVIVSAISPSLSSEIDPRFGKCRYLVFVNPETMEFEYMQNPNLMTTGECGVQTAQLVIKAGARAVITRWCSAEAAQILTAAGIEVITNAVGTVEVAVRKYAQGEFKAPAIAGQPTIRVGSEIMLSMASPEIEQLRAMVRIMRQELDEIDRSLNELRKRRIELLARQG